MKTVRTSKRAIVKAAKVAVQCKGAKRGEFRKPPTAKEIGQRKLFSKA